MAGEYEAFLKLLQEDAHWVGPEAEVQAEAVRLELDKFLDIVLEAPGDLSGPTAVDGALDVDEARVYEVRGTLLNLTMNDIVEVSIDPVPVLDDTGRFIGFASLYSAGGSIMVDGAICYQTPERLLIETGEVLTFRAKLDDQRTVRSVTLGRVSENSKP